LLEAADGFDAADADVLAVVGLREGHLGEAAAEGVGSSSHFARFSGRWKAKTRRERGSGSRSSRK
jgi:hypothetical protein